MTRTRQHSFSFEGRVALVTGGSAGIGRATALAFGAAGAVVVIADTNVDGGHASAAMIVEQGGKALFVKSDVTRANEVEALVDKAVASYGRLDFAFNNAGAEDEPAGLAESDEEAFDRLMALNVKGTWLCMKHELRQMLRQEGGGAIVNAASATALVGAAQHALGAASKHAVVGLTRSAAAEYAGSGIRVNSVCPGTIRTPAMARALERDPQRAQALLARHPAGRFGEARDVANAVLWLCSEHASFVTGHQLAVDGGLTAI